MTTRVAPSGATFSATLIGFSAIVLWSTLTLLTVLSGKVPPFQLAALTFAVGGVSGLIYAAARGRLSALIQPWRVWAVGVGGLFGYHALCFAAFRRAPPADASLINYLWPLLIVLFSAALPGERLKPRHVVGAALGFAGAATLLLAKGANFAEAGGAALLGYGLAFAGAFVWAGYSVLSRTLKGAPTEAVAGFCLATSALAALSHLAFETTVEPADAGQWLAILGLGLGPVGLAFYVWDYGVKHGDIRMLGVAAYAAPVMSTVLLIAAGVAPATPSLALACARIVGGAAGASRNR